LRVFRASEFRSYCLSRCGDPRTQLLGEHARHLIQKARAKTNLPRHVTLAACRHGGMTELGDAGLTEPQIISLSAHETVAAAPVYVKRTEVQRLSAARKRRQFVERAE